MKIYYNEHFGGFMTEKERLDLENYESTGNITDGYWYFEMLDGYLEVFESEKAARTFLYKLRRDYGNDPTARNMVKEAFQSARRIGLIK